MVSEKAALKQKRKILSGRPARGMQAKEASGRRKKRKQAIQLAVCKAEQSVYGVDSRAET